MHNTIPLLPPKVRQQVVGGVVFGDTKNKQSNASIEGVPKDQLKTFCNENDGVCWGKLNVNAGHLSYNKQGDAKKAADFLVAKLAAAGVQ
jgi:cutinase